MVQCQHQSPPPCLLLEGPFIGRLNLLAAIYHLGVWSINTKGWPITTAEVSDAENNDDEYTECLPPVIKDVDYTQVGYKITANWTAAAHCLEGVEISSYLLRWQVAHGTPSETNRTSRRVITVGTTTDSFVIPEDSDLRSVTLADVSIVPSELASHWILHGISYPVPQSFINDFDTTVFISGLSASNTTPVAGTQVDLTVTAQTWRAGGAMGYKWQKKIGGSWQGFDTNPNTAIAPVRADEALTRTYRVIVTHTPTEDDQYDTIPGPGVGGVARAISPEITIQWVPTSTSPPTPTPSSTPTLAPATPTPTPTPAPTAAPVYAGTLLVFLPGQTVGQALEEFEMPQSTSVRVEADDLEPANMLVDIVASGSISVRAINCLFSGTRSDFAEQVYACNVGSGEIRLLERTTHTVLDRIAVTVVPPPTPTATATPAATATHTATPSPTATSTPYGRISASPTTLLVGQSTNIVGRYTVGGSGSASISYPVLYFSRNRYCPLRDSDSETRNSGVTSLVLWACRAGTPSVSLNEVSSRDTLATVVITINEPPTPTPTPTATPEPVVTGNLSASNYTIYVGDTTQVTVFALNPSDAETYFRISGPLDTRESCVRRSTELRTIREWFYGCWPGRGTVKLMTPAGDEDDLDDDDEIARVSILVEARPTATPTPTPLPPPEITSVTLSGTTLRAYYDRPSGTNYYRFTIYQSSNGEYRHVNDRFSPVYFSGLPRGYSYYVRGRSCPDSTYTDCGNLGNRSATRTVPTVTNTPTPTATATRTPVPSTGSLSASRTSIRVGQSTRITARYTLGTNATEARLSYTSRVSVNSDCPRSDTREHVLARAVDRYTLYGCSAGTATVRLLEIPGREELATLTITVTSPPTATPTRTPTPTATPVPVSVPKPTNLTYNTGDTWLYFRWRAPSGYSTFQVTLDDDDTDVTRTNYTYRNLTPATEYDFEVRTKASDGRLSDELSATVSTDCEDDFSTDCSDRARSTAMMIEFGDGNHFVNRDIQPGTYIIGSTADAEGCEWGRLDYREDTEDQLVETGGYSAGATVTVRPDDDVFFTFGCGIWTKNAAN